MLIFRGVIAFAFTFLMAFGEDKGAEEGGDVAPKPRPDLPPNDSLRVGVKRRAKTPCDEPAKDGDAVLVHYTGWLRATADKFDSSRDRKEPFKLSLGQGMVIKGWELGILGMCPGEIRRLTIPSDLGYGEHGSGEKIPGNATLVFDVELISINPEDVEEEDDEDDNDPLFAADDDEEDGEGKTEIEPEVEEDEDDL
ncbi:Peptidyl-prolyl cis-trans isomerase [Perkinsus olseni]|uniref:peptidylprolyl isomerase n=1 Tax=Perkinsus olseni TaxID=32597 RepID=A0A7J6U4T2_PEROL|nr:Peptidyl-prolyl cis-trans isomerase [Perkinsus olseni]